MYTSEIAGMSNYKAGENPAHRKNKVSWATFIVPGLVGPKPRTKVVGDGQQVDIPVPATLFPYKTQDGSVSGFLAISVQVRNLGLPRRNTNETNRKVWIHVSQTD